MTGLFISSSDSKGECPIVRQNTVETQPMQTSDREKVEPRDDERRESDIFNLARMISYRANARRRLRHSSGII
jgi:hypothetical protein